MHRLSFDCEELLHWWEPKTDISFIFNFNWRSLQQLREAITIFLSARLNNVAKRAAVAITETGCPHLKCMMASNPHTPADLLDFLSEVSCPSILERIAENPSTAKDTLSRLAFHPDPDVRSAVAENNNTPETCFKRLIHDESADVRYRIAENPFAPVTSLYTLLRDENPYVANRAKQTLARILINTIADQPDDLRHSQEQALRTDLLAHSEERLNNNQLIEDIYEVSAADFVAIDYSAPETPV
ncbi:MAG: hypothetical protein K2X27_05775 [Candidatus Obscuribacterales bacterium]|nr:hypothetical protein [Candidatus Obscuribacterales bacterium]